MTRRRRALNVFLIAIAVGLVVLFGLPVCPTASLFGIPCPGCGLTRATFALLRGDFAEAAHLHPLVFVAAPLVAALAGTAVYEYVRGPLPREAGPGKTTTFWMGRAPTVLGGLLVAALLGVWGARFLGYFGGPVSVETLRERALGSKR